MSSSKIKERIGFADYLNVKPTQETADYELMGAGFTDLNEAPSAKTSSKRYVNDKSETKRITGYDWSVAYTTDQIRSEPAVDFICNIGEKMLTGTETETDYVRVDLDKPVSGKESTYEARYHKIAVEVANFDNNDGEMAASGNLLGIGDVVLGEFNTKTKVFTEASAATSSQTQASQTTQGE